MYRCCQTRHLASATHSTASILMMPRKVRFCGQANPTRSHPRLQGAESCLRIVQMVQHHHAAVLGPPDGVELVVVPLHMTKDLTVKGKSTAAYKA